MSDMTGQRITLISDPTSEFPKNMNTDFKVCLQQPLDLPGTGWEAALVSLSVPNRSIGWRQLGYTSDTVIVVRATAVLENESGVLTTRTITISSGPFSTIPLGCHQKSSCGRVFPQYFTIKSCLRCLVWRPRRGCDNIITTN